MKKIKRAYDIVITTENISQLNAIKVSVHWVECVAPAFNSPKNKTFSFILPKETVYNCGGSLLRSALMYYMYPIFELGIPELVHEARKFIEKAVHDHETAGASFAPDSDSDILSSKSYELPGIRDRAVHPITGFTHPLRNIIMNLNDSYKWTREQIADWLDEISDPTGESGPDIRFKLKESHE